MASTQAFLTAAVCSAVAAIKVQASSNVLNEHVGCSLAYLKSFSLYTVKQVQLCLYIFEIIHLYVKGLQQLFRLMSCFWFAAATWLLFGS